MVEIGLIGKPNAGKSSFLKAATMLDVKIAPIPFTTLKPNVAIAYVTKQCVESFFNVKCNPKTGACENGTRYIPIKLIDLPGIVPKAHEGRGLGLKFLDEARKCEALIHVVDFSGMTDEEGKPSIDHNPENDIKFVEEEINAWFKEIISRGLEKLKKNFQRATKEEIVSTLEKQLSGLEVKKQEIEMVLEEVGIEDLDKFSRRLRELSKPIVIVANKIDLESSRKNFEKLKNKYHLIPASAEAEIALRLAKEKKLIKYENEKIEILGELNQKQKDAIDRIRRDVIEKFGSTGIQKALNYTVFDVLKYITVYPVADRNRLSDSDGRILPDAFLVKNGTKLKEFAFIIHTEIGSKFITGIDVKTKKSLSADYILKDNDVIEIVHAR
ncbi:MAG: YchF-related putative GTPase [Candidatus Aenigmarchaeota archaeon]|nr:YchF-related putative GTPase [Candidatus Aenigmarchaeota archaeon]MCX8190973.1 YchF-related putative GTPase [Candidatus Aenigmarchaeota archaeon]MDW8160232.1 YchF-related putative GTPase [Candidatus Aenigmarchaeota archaeon]